MCKHRAHHAAWASIRLPTSCRALAPSQHSVTVTQHMYGCLAMADQQASHDTTPYDDAATKDNTPTRLCTTCHGQSLTGTSQQKPGPSRPGCASLCWATTNMQQYQLQPSVDFTLTQAVAEVGMDAKPAEGAYARQHSITPLSHCFTPIFSSLPDRLSQQSKLSKVLLPPEPAQGILEECVHPLAEVGKVQQHFMQGYKLRYQNLASTCPPHTLQLSFKPQPATPLPSSSPGIAGTSR